MRDVETLTCMLMDANEKERARGMSGGIKARRGSSLGDIEADCVLNPPPQLQLPGSFSPSPMLHRLCSAPTPR